MANKDYPGKGKVAVLRTRPETVLDDYKRLMELAGYQEALPKDKDTILKINISWQTFYPACSTMPWQLEGVIRTLQEAGYGNLIAAHNRTVVVDAYVGERNNKHKYVVEKHGVRNVHLYEPPVEWVVYEPKAPMLVLDRIYPEGIKIPKMFIGRNIIQLPTVKCVHPDTEIVLGDGSLVRIGDLVEGKLRQGGIPLLDEDGDLRITANETLFSLADSGAVVPQNTRLFWRTPLNGHKLWLVRTRTGREVKVSGEHPFRTPEGWRKASELRVGDRVAIPRRIKVQGESQLLPDLKQSLSHDKIDLDKIPFRPGRKFSIKVQRQMVQEYLDGCTLEEVAAKYGVPWQSVQAVLNRYDIPFRRMKKWINVPKKTSPDFWRWMGYFIAEGWVQPTRTTTRFWWSNSDPQLQADFAQLTEKLFGLSLTCRPASGDHYFDSVQMHEFFEKLGLPVPLDAGNKRVPALLFKCPDEEIASFLQGYFDGDGTVDKKGGFHLSTKSERLARDVQELLSRLGVVAFRSQTWQRATNASAPAQPYAHIAIYGDELVTLSRWIRFRSEHKQRRLEYMVARRGKSKRPSNWDTIPLPPNLFRQVREGLKLTQASSGKPGSVNNIENARVQPTRPIVRYFVELFRRTDIHGRFAPQIEEMAFLAHPQLAWDHIIEVEEIEPDTEYLYDFTMASDPSFIGNGIFLHNTHVFTTITGAMKNAFGGLLSENRHWTHAVIDETVVDLLTIQQEIHPGLFAVMDGTFAGDGPGPRAMRWHEKDVILASADQVAIDAISAKLQGFDPMSLKFIRLAHELGLGVGDPRDIEIVGDVDVMEENWHFVQEETFASRGQKMIYHGPLKPFEHLLLRSPLVPWSYFASNFYHNVYWYPFVGRKRVAAALETKWGQLFESYGADAGLEGAVLPGIERKTAAIGLLGLAGVLSVIGAGLWLWKRGRKG